MPNLDFYFTTEEVREVLVYLLSYDYRLLIEKDVSEPVHEIIHKADELFQLGYYNELVFIMHKDYTLTLPPFRPFVRDRQNLFYLSQGEGGPTIDLFWIGRYPLEVSGVIAFSSLSLNSHYYVDNEKVPVGEEAKAYFKIIRKEILKKAAGSFVTNKRRFWVSQAVIELIQKGYQIQFASEENRISALKQLGILA